MSNLGYPVFCYWIGSDANSDEERILVTDQDAHDFMSSIGIVGLTTRYDRAFGLQFRRRNKRPFTKEECQQVVDIVDAQDFAKVLTA